MTNQNIASPIGIAGDQAARAIPKADVGGEAGKGSTERMRQDHAFENLGDEGQITTKLKGCNRGVTVTTDLPTLFTTAP
jgi:hypothetical protein